jgi:hypothetical protein
VLIKFVRLGQTFRCGCSCQIRDVIALVLDIPA